MKLKTEYTVLKEKILNRYNELVSLKDYDFTARALENYKEEDRETIKRLLDEGTYEELFQYDFQEYLTQVFYNDRKMDEKLGYLLSVSKKDGLYILNEDTDNAFFIGFNDLNGEHSKLEVIEQMEEFETEMQSWIGQLEPIIKEYKDGDTEPLSREDVDILTNIIRAKINLKEGNITENDYNHILDGNVKDI